MASAEEKIDAVLAEVKNLTVGQLKLTNTVDNLHKRSIDAELISAELAAEVKNLKSRLEALETLSTTPTPAPPREEEEPAKGHCIINKIQGSSEGVLTTQNSLVRVS